ncbi:hypothetical protein Tco_0105258 [Tanacetum coccineum]
MEIKDKLDLDKNGTLVDAMKYQSMIGSLMYLTSSKLKIVHATYADYAGCRDSFKRTFRGTQFLGEKLAENPVVCNVGLVNPRSSQELSLD